MEMICNILIRSRSGGSKSGPFERTIVPGGCSWTINSNGTSKRCVGWPGQWLTVRDMVL